MSSTPAPFLDEDLLGRCMPTSTVQARAAWAEPLRDAMTAYGIETAERMAGFLASVSNETGQLHATKETTYYNTPYERVLAIFGGARAPSQAQFNQWRSEGPVSFYAKFFDWVYDDRRVNIGLGNTQDGDGSKYVGRGVGLTGRYLYTKYGAVAGIDLVNNPDMLLQPKWAAITIAALWKDIGNNERMDRGDFVGAMRVMNPGLPSFANHIAQYNHILPILRAPDLKRAPPKPAPATPTQAATQAVTGKTGVAVVTAGAASTITVVDAVSKVSEVRTLSDATKGFLGTFLPSPYTEIALGVLVVACLGFVLWRYGRKLLRGEAVST